MGTPLEAGGDPAGAAAPAPRRRDRPTPAFRTGHEAPLCERGLRDRRRDGREGDGEGVGGPDARGAVRTPRDGACGLWRSREHRAARPASGPPARPPGTGPRRARPRRRQPPRDRPGRHGPRPSRGLGEVRGSAPRRGARQERFPQARELEAPPLSPGRGELRLRLGRPGAGVGRRPNALAQREQHDVVRGGLDRSREGRRVPHGDEPRRRRGPPGERRGGDGPSRPRSRRAVKRQASGTPPIPPQRSRKTPRGGVIAKGVGPTPPSMTIHWKYTFPPTRAGTTGTGMGRNRCPSPGPDPDIVVANNHSRETPSEQLGRPRNPRFRGRGRPSQLEEEPPATRNASAPPRASVIPIAKAGLPTCACAYPPPVVIWGTMPPDPGQPFPRTDDPGGSPATESARTGPPVRGAETARSGIPSPVRSPVPATRLAKSCMNVPL